MMGIVVSGVDRESDVWSKWGEWRLEMMGIVVLIVDGESGVWTRWG